MYLLFFGYDYYPVGGWKDYRGSFATIEAAKEFLTTASYDWYQIVCGGEIVSSGG